MKTTKILGVFGAWLLAGAATLALVNAHGTPEVPQMAPRVEYKNAPVVEPWVEPTIVVPITIVAPKPTTTPKKPTTSVSPASCQDGETRTVGALWNAPKGHESQGATGVRTVTLRCF